MNSPKTVVHWFRKGLRIHDNPALIDAIQFIREHSEQHVLRPVFILDPDIIKWLVVGPNRWRFLQQSLAQLDQNLRGINSRLYVVRGNPTEVFPKLFKEWKVSLLTYEADIEPYSRERDKLVGAKAVEAKVKVITQISHTIYDPEAIIAKNGGSPPLTYQKFASVSQMFTVPQPIPAAVKLPDAYRPQSDVDEKKNSHCYDVPTLKELGVDEKDLGPNLYPGGETEALDRLEKNLAKVKWICAFEKPNTSPNSLEPSTTVLSPYLKFGCLSARLFYQRLKEIYAKNRSHSQPPVSLEGQLMWREFYYCAGSGIANFDRMVGNSVCVQVPWEQNEQYLDAWTHGRTGYPFIDAIMRQLRQEGWIHHLARHSVACFLTRGDLWISWEQGQKVFEELLLDADWALNAGNWMWLSASAFFHQFYRVYSPVAFGKKTDPDGKYIKKYVPELRKYPAGIIYEPWKASLKVQKELGCIIGKDYPNRIVVHEDVYKINIGKLAAAYEKKRSLKAPSAKLTKKSSTATADKRKASPSTSATKKKSKVENNTLSKYLKKK